MIETATSVLIIIGVFFIFVGTLGLIRLPDVYNRLHATTKSSTLGVIGVLAASVVYFSAQGHTFSVKQIGAIFFLYLSSPVGAHMIARAAYLVGIPLSERTVRDDLKERHDTFEHYE